ncbi:MAG: nitrogenase iron-molybdenum cofactor biosynthesis protein NifE [Formivibrio sp.]|nr:nitrogenase iron-molybdenum cofactor biosynthesis protein NifE [Formivibrio sp.]
MNARDLTALMTEPACEHQHAAKPKAGCSRPKPGATAGGCTFDGAQIALLPISDAAHIVHGPIGCAGSSWDSRGARTTGPGLYRYGLTTDLSEQDIIMGRGEKRLFLGIKQAIERFHPAAIFVYATCVTALVGDDLSAVCQAAEEKFGVPIVPVDCAGFYGSKNLGNRIAGETLLKYVIGTREPEPAPAGVHNISLIGEFNIAGELWHVMPLFDELGLRVLSTLAGDSRFAELQTMHRGEANMLVCSKALQNVARKLQERHGTPWFEGSFYGVRDMGQSLRDFARLLNDPDLAARTEALIAREEAKLDEALAPYRAILTGKKAVLYTGGVKSWSIVSALQDLGIEVVATGTKKSTEADKSRIRDLMGDEAHMIEEGTPAELVSLVDQYQADILIAGGRNLYTGLKARIPFLDVNQEREFAFAGYTGMVTLAQRLVNATTSPIWPLVRSSAPWEA